MTMISAGASRPLGQPHHLRPEPAVRDLEDRRGARTTLSHFDDSSDEDDYDDDNDSNINNKNNATNNDHDDDFSARDNGQDVQTPTPSSHSHIPLHPIPSMQEAFAESLEEATKADVTSQKPKLRDQDPKQRRDRLLDQDRSQGPPNRLWRFRPGQRCHELRKLIAQISFGVELLIKGMANSDAQVLSILQGHIDEVDEFLEAAMEDVQQATLDLKQRLDFLKVPLQNMDVFEQMLENRKFRLQIVEGNVKIEHILSRTSTAHTQTIRDVSEGLWGVKQFAHYLKENEKGPWRQDRPDVVDVFEAMKGNTDGWHSAFTTLESNSTLLSGLLVQLSSLVNDIDKKAGEVSRRTRVSQDSKKKIPFLKKEKRFRVFTKTRVFVDINMTKLVHVGTVLCTRGACRASLPRESLTSHAAAIAANSETRCSSAYQDDTIRQHYELISPGSREPQRRRVRCKVAAANY